MKKTYWAILGLIALCALIVTINSATAVVCIGSQMSTKWGGPDTTADVIFIKDGAHDIQQIFDTANITSAMISQISSGADSRYLLNVSIQVNETGVLIIDSDSDWLMLSSIDGAIANITSYGRMFINGSLITAVIPSTGGLNGSANDTAYATGAKSRPYIAVNNSETTGDGTFVLGTGTRIAYLGGNLNESWGGVSVNDSGGTPVFTCANTHISHCYRGLFLKSVISGTAITQLNITNCDVFGLVMDADTAFNFTNCNFTNNGGGTSCDISSHSDVVCTINNTGGLGAATYLYSGGDINNYTQKFRTVARTRGNTGWNLSARDVQVTTSDNDYCNVNLTCADYSSNTWTGETLDANFVQFVWPGLTPTQVYTLQVDGASTTASANPCTDGHVTLNYTGTWSTKTFAIIPTSTGGGGSTTLLVDCYRCQNGNVVYAKYRADCPNGWSETRPDCGAETTVTPPSQSVGAEGDEIIEGEHFFYIIVGIAAIALIANYVPGVKGAMKGAKSTVKTKNGIIIVVALAVILIVALWYFGVI